MALNVGTRLGPYEIVSAIGAGGMGEVYKARDTRLDRLVAIKILPEQFAADPGRDERFQREARAVAALNHAHICALHDVGEAPSLESRAASPESIRFLVMEYLEGQTLAERLLRGPLSPAELMRCAIEITDALDHAHRRGLVHRDLKPGNVMLTKSGAKLLDFGLSKLQARPDVVALSTVTPGVPLTAEGAVLGTFPYMAPEQLAGREADARSDVFAFGATLYEMATGRRAFEGETAATVIGAVLHTDPPPLSTVQPLAPPLLDRLIARCLAKDPDDRWQTARDLTLELKWIADHAAPVDAERKSAGTRLLGLNALIGVAIVTAVIVGASMRRAPAGETTASLAFTVPDGVTLTEVPSGGSVEISPDGLRVAFVASDRDGPQRLYVRAIDSFGAQALPETDGAMYPFWSPDSRFIGFFAQRKLKKIQIAAGPPQLLCDAIQPRGGTWSRDGVILFADGAGHQLSRVSSSGGAAVPIAADGLNVERYWPSFLPDGRHFVYFARPQAHGIYLAALDSTVAKLLLSGYEGASYAAPGYLLLVGGGAKGAAMGTLLAQPFDLDRYIPVGEPSPVAEQIGVYSGFGRADFSVSANGRLVFRKRQGRSTRLTWFDRRGTPVGDVPDSSEYNSPVLSADDKTVAAERFDPGTRVQKLWLIQTSRGTASRFTSESDLDLNTWPVWSPDGRWIVFASSGRGAPPNLYQKAADSTGTSELLVKSNFNSQPTDWSRDGRFIVYASLNPRTMWDLWLLPMTGVAPDRKPQPLLVSDYNEHAARFSPDGRWLAYVSDELQRNEVYVKAFSGPGAKQRVSTNGGTDPHWRADGSELFYLAADGTMMAVSVKPGASLEIGEPTRLFNFRATRQAWGYNPNFVVSRDGQRFLVTTVVEEPDTIPRIIVNWPAALRR